MSVSRLVRSFGILAIMTIELSCGNTYRPVANPITPNSPSSNFSHMVVVVSGNGLNNPGASTTIDVSGDTAVAQATVGLAPNYAAFVANGTRVFVTNSNDDTISEYAPSTPTPVTTIGLPVGSVPVSLASTETGTLYVAELGNGTTVPGTVSAISVVNNAIANTIPIPTAGVARPVSLAELPNTQKVYVANAGTPASVLSINVVDKSVNSAIPPCSAAPWTSPNWVVARSDSQRAYVLDQGSGYVSAIDTGLVSGTESVVSCVPVGVGADFMFYDPTRDRLYVTNPATNQLIYLDASSDILTSAAISIPTPVAVTALPDGSRAYVTSTIISGSTVTAQVTVVNAASGTVKATIPLGSMPVACTTRNAFELFPAAAADSSRVYVGNCDAGNTSIISTASDSIVLNLLAPNSAGQPPSVHISGATQSGTNTTYAYTLTSGPALRVGMSILITGMADAGNNGSFLISALGSGTLTVTNPSGVTDSGQNGKGLASPPPQNPVFVVAGP